MWRFVLRRIIWSIPVILLLIFTVFALMRALPGGPFDFAGDKSLPKAVSDNLKRRYHLDWPLHLQFSSYLMGDDVTHAICRALPVVPGCDLVLASSNLDVSKGVIRGDLGMAMRQRGRTVNDIISESFPISLQLGIMAILFGLLLGIPLGTLAALRQNTAVDYLASFFAVLGLSIPSLVLGPLLIWIFALKLGWLPVSTWGAKPPFLLGFIPIPTADFVLHAILPVTALGVALTASIARLTRASLLQVIGEDYIRTARAKGLPGRILVVRHALRNSLIPVVTILGPLTAGVVTGSFITEFIFGIPGMGKHFITSISNRDYSLISGATLVYALILVLANLTVDILYAWLDPRIRYD
ncbi:MAG: peptide ABC transporter permease [Chloroflexi bacterium]|nr:MAG: peptide ABC transporter permease [Chloroflexota bacterium]